MPTSEYMASLAKQYETLNKLIEEAENSQSRGESIKLYYKAQQKTANITEKEFAQMTEKRDEVRMELDKTNTWGLPHQVPHLGTAPKCSPPGFQNLGFAPGLHTWGFASPGATPRCGTQV